MSICANCERDIRPAVIDDDGDVEVWEDVNGITVCRKRADGEQFLHHRPMPAPAGTGAVVLPFYCERCGTRECRRCQGCLCPDQPRNCEAGCDDGERYAPSFDPDGPGYEDMRPERARRAGIGVGGKPIDRPPVVCLCGSTRFYEAFRAANLRLTLAGQIVLSIGCDFRSDDDLAALGDLAEDPAVTKQRLDELHKRKIDLADYVLVLNVGGYIGESTRGEISYATTAGKPVRYLEPESGGAR
jgi:hypothetical protein